jgi:hypothetical protein
MFNWYREWLLIRKESRTCESCETLRSQLELVNYEKKQLLDRILERPEKETTKESNSVVLPPRNIPWNVRRQLLETEDRERAKLMREAPKVNQTPLTTEELEKDLDIASAEREAKTS